MGALAKPTQAIARIPSWELQQLLQEDPVSPDLS
jgi:hypothetical protein